MLHSISKISGAHVMNKLEQSAIQGGFNSSCQQTCRQDFVDCREDGYSHCFESLRICQSQCG